MGIKRLYLLTALLLVMVLATTACHTTQTKAPPSGAASQCTGHGPVLAELPQTIAEPVSPPASHVSQDPVADLIATRRKRISGLEKKDSKPGIWKKPSAASIRAADLLLQSPADIRSDERVEHELERVLEGVNRPELASLQSDSATAKQKAEPAPIDETNEITPPVDPNVKAQAEVELKGTHSEHPLMLTDPVAGTSTTFRIEDATSWSMGWSAAAAIAK